ncbi:retrovirus-related pol polyprotein from transposon TNT 1-94 [Tanacetum coccineum]
MNFCRKLRALFIDGFRQTIILKSISSLLRELTVGSHESAASDVNVSLKTIAENSVLTDPRRNHTLVEAARTILIFSKAPMFLWAEVVATEFFGALCYPTNDSEDLGKLNAKADIGIFVGYAPNRKGYRIYNKRTRRIMETIHVQFDELTEHMAPVHISSGPEPILLTPRQISSGLVPNPPLQLLNSEAKGAQTEDHQLKS